ncbi:1-deoxy-D-xylulose-5-phosphate reductoisomerase [Sanguibacter gelidistatuariae]|uniref:1-deoxy-D-xylulose-5-phosphate reductoisomerase n=1 Tax=Sanguibacter gelidistatuariae TaxID=1814289 RepID=UPI000B8642E5|nr:1-deoxy-D-xylulose-5-phosphate reductoisomerase [Sanguibacter gelidistatuariae]
MSSTSVSGDPRSVALLGSTGSIGTQALDVISRHRDRFQVASLSAGGANLALLAEQVVAFDVPLVAIADDARRTELARHIALRQGESGRPVRPVEILAGPEAATALAGAGADVVLNGITGSVGLGPTLAALAAGSSLALANKESLVVGGSLVKAAQRRGDQIVPVDSEHSAIAQCLRSGEHREVRRLILTASGGPFRGWARDDVKTVTPDAALAHPTWSMGPVVTINSATLMNKGLELIEAHLLFDVPVRDITVVVHPQSVVHSMVEFVDGSTIAQASPPDMRLPIALGLSWPERLSDVATPCRWTDPTSWTFEALDEELFGAVRLAREVAEASGTYPAVYNAANEECVAAFLAGRIGFLDIVETVERVVAEHVSSPALTLEAVLAAEGWARRRAQEMLSRR